MATEITMPKLSDTMTEGLFARWIKNVGERVERGDILAEVETDKAVMELEAFASGVLIKTMVSGGEKVQVGTVLGLIGEAGEMADSAAARQPITASAQTEAIAASPEPEVPHAAPATAPSQIEMEHEKASPLVRRLAREQGIDLERIKGSGPEGRITQGDLVDFVGQQGKPETAAAASPKVAPVISTDGAVLSPMRQAIASAVTLAWQTIPHFSVTVEIDMDACREIVRELKERPDPVGYNALVIKACAGALLNFPLLRSGGPASSSDIHINFAVSKPDGVLMPVIRQCQSLTVAEIEIEIARLADKSRAGRLTSEEMTGGSFSVSNLGMYGVDEFTALITPGQTAILAVGAVSRRPVVRNGQLAVASTMRVTLSSDHRMVDGAYAASFLAELRQSLQKPVSLLL
ncbi:MAG: dihydrolipoamide acetyltransferase family protein [Desulfuromonadaceae bacterium]